MVEINRIVNNYFPMRTQIVVGQLRQKGWYATLAAPVLGGQGGATREVSRGFQLNMMAEGTAYYTTDGSDPRVPGGMPTAKAQKYATPVSLDKDTVVRARTQAADGSWSALVEATFKVK
jgi:hypothetical protein